RRPRSDGSTPEADAMPSEDPQARPTQGPLAGEPPAGRGVLQAVSPLGLAAAVLLAGLAMTAAFARNEWLESRAQAEVLYESLADAAQARVRDPLEAAA